jgi:hypothetical protein
VTGRQTSFHGGNELVFTHLSKRTRRGKTTRKTGLPIVNAEGLALDRSFACSIVFPPA